ncbi:hypothetical protein [Cumulibacter manganitolerans]|uniref:hypothetical protein n=1 Tax=Cumulibacter manganitolerans TaxID=1884992 RepID=UPI001296F874|nr:hypothetical protein [Cumulibacter manganitolerans]
MNYAFTETKSSQTARQLVLLPARTRDVLRISDGLVALIDVLVTVCHALTDDADKRPWQERLGDVFQDRYKDLDALGVADELNRLQSVLEEGDAREWARRFRSSSAKMFLRRLLGAKLADELERAVLEDAAVVTAAVRRGVRLLMPYSVAIEDAISMLTPADLSQSNLSGAEAKLLSAVIEIDRLLGEQVVQWLGIDSETISIASSAPFSSKDVEQLTLDFRAFVSADSSNQIARVNASLVRKVRGARQALDHSVDGVSQAANSIVELIDRLLREAMPKDVVLAWLQTNFRNDGPYVRINDSGERVPTKRGEALCFIFGASPIRRAEGASADEVPALHDAIALSLVRARSSLQALKHADDPTENETASLRNILAAVEGALLISVKLGLASRNPAEADAVVDAMSLDNQTGNYTIPEALG